ncbi:hypothetical protein [Archangium sp.]|jgi:hypothetical protein|uniref:hypothetical protein n=1 Tax=Archangium sp. TaxID=1872627 RepID=UPI002ED7E974
MPPVSHLYTEKPLEYASNHRLLIRHYLNGDSSSVWSEAPFLLPCQNDTGPNTKGSQDFDNYRFNIRDCDLLKLVDLRTSVNSRRRSTLVHCEMTTEQHDTVVRFHPEPGANRFPAYFLPWRQNQITCIELGTQADFFFTSMLTGCSVYVSTSPGKPMKPWVYHANGLALVQRSLRTTNVPSGSGDPDTVELLEYLGNGGPSSRPTGQGNQPDRSIEYMDKLYSQARPHGHTPSKRLTKSTYYAALKTQIAGRNDWSQSPVSVFGIRDQTGWRFHFQLGIRQHVGEKVVAQQLRVHPLP